MDASSRLPGHYPETPHVHKQQLSSSAARYTPSNNNAAAPSPLQQQQQQHASLGSSRAGGPIRKHSTQTRARAPSTPYQRPAALQNTPTSGPRTARPDYNNDNDDDDDDDDDEDVRGIKKTLGEKTVELVGTLVSGVKDWFNNSKTPKGHHVQSVVPRKRTPQRSATSRMEEGLDDDVSAEVGLLTRRQEQLQEDNMFSPSLAPHYAGHTPYYPTTTTTTTATTTQTDSSCRWVVKQRTSQRVLAPEPPIFPLPNTNPSHRRQNSQGKYATLPAKRSAALVPHATSSAANKRPRQQGSQSSLRQPKEWELSKDRFAEQDHETLSWCDKYGIEIVALASGTQKRPPLPSFQDIQRYEALRNDVAFFERQGIRHVTRHKPSHLRHATSSYELSRLAQENAALYLDPTESSTSKLATLNKLLRLKESRAKIDLEAAQLERSKARNGYSTLNGSSRGSSRTRGMGMGMGDDVWILPGLGVGRPGSSGSRRSFRMRTLSPGVEGVGSREGSWRSQDAGRRSRPRGRDIFPVEETMVDEGVQTQPSPSLFLPAPPPPPSETAASMKDVVVEILPRRKRPGVFSAREEDLDELEMDVDDDVVPARKKQRLTTTQQVPYGPKFAALWEPSRRENWPLPDDLPLPSTVETKTNGEEREKVREELKDLESPAFKLPLSARKEPTGSFMDVEPESPTREKGTGGVQGDGFSYKILSPEKSPEPTPAVPSFNLNFPTKEFKFDLAPPAKPQFSPPKPAGSEVDKDNVRDWETSPSKTAAFMQSILSQKEEDMEDIPATQPPKENGIKSLETQSTDPVSQPSQGFTFGTSQSTTSTEKAAINGGLFGGMSSFLPARQPSPPKETEKPTLSTTKFTFGQASKPAEPPKTEEVSKTAEPMAPKFNFGESKSEKKIEPPAQPSVPVLNIPKTDGATAGFGSFGGAFKKPETETSLPLFGETTEPAPVPGTEMATKPSEPAPAATTAPVYNSGRISFTFGQPSPPPATTVSSPKKEPTPPPPPPTTAPAPTPADNDESMDITDSPPASRVNSLNGAPSDVPSQFPAFPSSAPTSAPAPSTPAKPAFKFGQVNGTATTEKPATQPFSFGVQHENKPPAGFSTTFGAPATNAFSPTAASAPSPGPFSPAASAPATNPYSPAAAHTPNPFSPPAVSPTMSAPSIPGFGAPKPAEVKPVPSFGTGTGTSSGRNTAPADTKRLFGGSTTEMKPLFGQASTGIAPATTDVKPAFTFGTSAPPPESKSLFGQQNTNPPTFGTTESKSPFGTPTPSSAFGNTTSQPLFGGPQPPSFPQHQQQQQQPSITSPPVNAHGGVNAFVPPPSTSFTPTFNFNLPQTGINPFSNTTNPSQQPAPFTNSAPVSPQNQQLPQFPGQPFGAPQQPAPAAGPIFGGHIPTFNLGAADMARSSSDTGAGGTPGRRIAQPGRRRGQRRG